MTLDGAVLARRAGCHRAKSVVAAGVAASGVLVPASIALRRHVLQLRVTPTAHSRCRRPVWRFDELNQPFKPVFGDAYDDKLESLAMQLAVLSDA